MRNLHVEIRHTDKNVIWSKAVNNILCAALCKVCNLNTMFTMTHDENDYDDDDDDDDLR